MLKSLSKNTGSLNFRQVMLLMKLRQKFAAKMAGQMRRAEILGLRRADTLVVP